jgi:hypothetical protein
MKTMSTEIEDKMKAELDRSMARVVKKLAGEQHALELNQRKALVDMEALIDELCADLEERGVNVLHLFVRKALAEMDEGEWVPL